jgi:hypothetical protein
MGRYLTLTADITPGGVANFPIPQGKRMHLIAVTGTFTTGATVATRYPYIQFGNNVLALTYPTGDSITASLVRNYCFAPDGGTATHPSLTFARVEIPDIIVPPNGHCLLHAIAMDATDTWSSAYAFVELLDDE